MTKHVAEKTVRLACTYRMFGGETVHGSGKNTMQKVRGT